MYRAILPDGELDCERYEQTDFGVELYTAEDELIAFVPYANLLAIMNEEVDTGEDRSIF
jgi:hypothetical protein